MSEALTFQLKKPLEKMTVKELRELAIREAPQITGASGMEKQTLLSAIKETLGIANHEEGAPNPYQGQIASLKGTIHELQTAKLDTTDKTKRKLIRRKINKLKKHTRRMAHNA
ncbi:hypothetical protein GGQ74_001799 [Desulfobaculum xiamenense]|uniref:Rho termination factor N-terminal domain-containing protein n=1 Tax=Desulfobaculum xiamenense TaxID=995050 RepID=A0A846QH31_9BACT|nr:hypothetical protein [Desulfobaculum xiamenense]NJB68126.1 hypothetical protein [Desulfobaculum xiamenense]